MSPRIPSLPPEARDPRTIEILAGLLKLPNGEDLNVFQTLAHHPRLLKRWNAFGAILMGGGTLSDRDRELLVLRTVWNCHATYEWRHHERWGREIGLTDAEFISLKEDVDKGNWADWDETLLNAADELHHHSRIADATWARLAERLDEQQLIEVPALVGQYHLASFMVNSLEIELDC
jgi:4-carboxymuconolactone decarboxylase